MTIIDLDGTLLAGNSLIMYTRWATARALRRGHLHRAAGIAAWVLLRRLRIVSHTRMKWHILRLGAHYPLDGLLEVLQAEVRPEVAAFIDDDAVLATAADASYALPLGRKLGFGHVAATAPADRYADYRECRGQAKVEAVRAIAEAEGRHVTCVITDHRDDLPLLEVWPGARHILVEPSQTTLEAVKDISCEVIHNSQFTIHN